MKDSKKVNERTLSNQPRPLQVRAMVQTKALGEDITSRDMCRVEGAAMGGEVPTGE